MHSNITKIKNSYQALVTAAAMLKHKPSLTFKFYTTVRVENYDFECQNQSVFGMDCVWAN